MGQQVSAPPRLTRRRLPFWNFRVPGSLSVVTAVSRLARAASRQTRMIAIFFTIERRECFPPVPPLRCIPPTASGHPVASGRIAVPRRSVVSGRLRRRRLRIFDRPPPPDDLPGRPPKILEDFAAAAAAAIGDGCL